jgi:hypothetical protein
LYSLWREMLLGFTNFTAPVVSNYNSVFNYPLVSRISQSVGTQPGRFELKFGRINPSKLPWALNYGFAGVESSLKVYPDVWHAMLMVIAWLKCS